MTTAVRPLRIGIDGALLADSAVDALIDGRVYGDASKPENATLPFIALGTPTERDYRVFNRAGNDGVRFLHLYGIDEDQVEHLYGEVKRTLAAGVTVTGHSVLRLFCDLLEVKPDPGGGAHGLVRVSATTQAVA